MTDFALPSEWKPRLKAATRQLIREAGGLEAAAAVLGPRWRGTSTIQRWGDPKSEDMIPLIAAMTLQQETGLSLITQAMAELQGFTLSPKTGQGGGRGFLMAQQRIAKEMAEYHAAVALAVADGVITETEKADIDREGGDVCEAMAESRNDMAVPGVIHVFPRGA